MKNWFNRNYKRLIIFSFLIPIITVAIVSISHVTEWYGISNPLTWAIYLSVGIEIAALSALAAISANMGSKVYFPFGIVTLIQFIGNIYFAYQFIDVDSEQFKDWVELTSPLLEYIGIDPTDIPGHKRFLSLFSGGMLPIISLSFLHMLVRFTQGGGVQQEQKPETIENQPVVQATDLVGEISRVRISDDELEKLNKVILNKKPLSVNKLKDFSQKQDFEEKSDELDEEYENIIRNKEVKEPIVNSYPIKDEEVYPALSDEEIYTMNLDDYERKFDNVEPDMNYILEPSEAPKNVSEMMITTDNDIVNSIPSDDEKSDLDLPLETQPVVVEELPENQPISDVPKSEVVISDEEKKKN